MDMMYDCWLSAGKDDNFDRAKKYFCSVTAPDGRVVSSAVKELCNTAERLFGISPCVDGDADKGFVLRIDASLGAGAYKTEITDDAVYITGGDGNGVLYGVYRFLILTGGGYPDDRIAVSESPAYAVRMIDHWDNGDGGIERGYAGRSIFFSDYAVTEDMTRITDYARLLSSVGINAVCINNVNVHRNESYFITDRYLDKISALADTFGDYGIKLYLSVNYAAPIEIGGLDTADPLDSGVKSFWADMAKNIYAHIPGFGGFLVKADSENRPGPFTYGRDHADGANMLAEALRPYGGIVIWRCFVYNCHLDWRDRSIDRARAAYDHFKPLDGRFADNVYLQIKNGPMDFQIREAVSPLFSGLDKTNMFAEFQITQEYTGQQKDLCYLVPMWKECLDFNTFRNGKPFVKDRILGAAGVSNIGDSHCWTGDPLAGANLYGFGRLVFDPSLSAGEIAEEWVRASVTSDEKDSELITKMLLSSRDIYESYTSPLGVGWMVVPHYHYGVDIDGYEYSPWGTYHYSDCHGMGVDRTVATGTGYTSQYAPENADMYENIDTCPEELLLFFHHVPYTHMLKSGETLIQHIYDSHFEGADRAAELAHQWETLKGRVPDDYFETVRERFEMQTANAERWRDVVNTYFHRKSGIDDIHNRKVYD